MTLPTECYSIQVGSPGRRRFVFPGGNLGGVAALETRVEFQRFCEKCDCLQTFVAGWECQEGLVGVCLGCGDERVMPFTRTIGVSA
jgi:hypothetical protein